MTSIISPSTFIADEVQPTHGFWIDGTVEVTLGGKTRRLPATKNGEAITAFGLTGRYQTGMKAWPASATRVIDPTTGKAWDRVSFGNDDRSGRCKKTNMVFFKD